jgi:hypothetical protein
MKGWRLDGGIITNWPKKPDVSEFFNFDTAEKGKKWVNEQVKKGITT